MTISLRLLIFILFCFATAHAQTVLVERGTFWRYQADGENLGFGWRMPAYVDQLWSLGRAPIGYGSDQITVIAPPPGTVTTYFRHHFSVANPGAFLWLTLRVRRDDAAYVWLNGVPVFTADFPAGPPLAAQPAADSITDAAEAVFVELNLAPELLVAGDNVMAVEIHQATDGENDHIFDLELGATNVAALTRVPYLQQATPSGITVRWRTDKPVVGRVRYGAAPDHLVQSASEAAPTTEHVVEITGLTPDTRYYYSIGDATRVLAGGTLEHFFTTHPVAGTVKPVRVWILGDSGTGSIFNPDSRRVADAYKNSLYFKQPDVWLMLGDNAYGSGYDHEYQRAVFEIYPDFLRKTTLWSTMGNHETYNGEDPLPYFRIFTFPTNGEAGGMPSGTENYYSFDYANVHFVCLDSQTFELRADGSAMMHWLEADLAATAQKWIVAFWHHPPYTRGSHNSDWEGDLIAMRERFVPILEAAGVDLVLTGHSHNYERSCLINGHYGDSTTLAPTMLLNAGLGRMGEGGAYLKSPNPHNGTVYTVAGHSGQVATFAPVNHPINVVNWNILGSMFLDIRGDRLDARMIDVDGVIRDWFTIEKVRPVAIPPLPLLPTPHDAWRVAEFVNQASTPDIGGDLADPDKDGIPNLIERAFGLDPNAFSTHGLPFATPNGGAAITFCRPASTADLHYVVQFSTDLIQWTDGSSYHGTVIVPDTEVTEQVSIVPGNPEIITVRAKAPALESIR